MHPLHRFSLLLGLLLILAFPAHAKTPLDAAFDQYAEENTRARVLGGGLSLAMGALSGFGGFLIFANPKYPGDEQVAGLGLMAAGAITGSEGFIRMFSESALSYRMKNYRETKPGEAPPIGKSRQEYGERAIEEEASDAKRDRRLRGVLDIASAAGGLYLALKPNRTLWRDLLYPSIGYAAVGLYRWIFSSPEERALDRLREGRRSASHHDVDFIATPEIAWVQWRLSF